MSPRRPKTARCVAAAAVLVALVLVASVLGLAAARHWRVARSVDVLAELDRHQDRFRGIAVEPVSIAGSSRKAIVTDLHQVVLREVPVFAGARLRFSIAVEERMWELPGDGVTFKVHLQAGPHRKLLYTRYVDPKSRPLQRRWIDVDVALDQAMPSNVDLPSTVNLALSTSAGMRGDARHDAAVWADVRVERDRWRSPKWGMSAAWPPWRAARRPNVVLISIDTLRDDRVGATSNGASVTPRIDEFARQGFRFRRTYAAANHTLLSHMSLLTGLYPKTHGVNRGKNNLGRLEIAPLADARVTLAETLQAHGYVTGGFAFSCVWMDARFGFAQGFDRYRVQPRSAAKTNDRDVFPWLDANHRDPFFLFVHFYDVHSDWSRLPYDAPKRFRARHQKAYRGKFNGCDKGACGTRYLKKLDVDRTPVAAPDLAYIRTLYDAGVEATDHEVGRLIDRLADLGVLDDTLVVITSDHGEEFREHGRFIHSQLYDEIARVPLLIRLPGVVGADATSDHPVELQDVMPTILDVVGIAPEAATEGRSLRPLIEGDEIRSRPVFITGTGIQAVVDWPWKLVRGIGGEQLYNLEADPLERDDVKTAEPKEAKRLQSTLAEWTHGPENKRKEPGGAVIDPNDADIERLRALGYVD